MTTLKAINNSPFRYNHIVGTGGIGSGIFFSLEGNHILGRDESRSGKLEPFRDYCKQHIILHYISVLLGAGKDGAFYSIPIGKIGQDEIGKQLLAMMKEAGMDVSNVKPANEAVTLFSVCFQYPDHSGGNITSNNSASMQVLPADIDAFFDSYKYSGKKGIVIAAPEVQVETRIRLLEKGKEKGLLKIASLLSTEIDDFMNQKGFELTDILSINMDEARHISGLKGDQPDSEMIVGKCMRKLKKVNPTITVLITDGGNGSYCLQKNNCEFTPSLKTRVLSTAGAGDAFLAGTIAGICCGLPLFKGFSSKALDQYPLQTAVELGTVLASFSVTSADTIHPDANADSLSDYLKQSGLELSEGFVKMFA